MLMFLPLIVYGTKVTSKKHSHMTEKQKTVTTETEMVEI